MAKSGETEIKRESRTYRRREKTRSRSGGKEVMERRRMVEKCCKDKVLGR